MPEGSMFGVGGYKSNYKYLSRILDLFEEVEGTLDAHGNGGFMWGCSHINLCNYM
jgi:hypothetical protein